MDTIESHIGKFARSIESGWLGNIVEIDRRDVDYPMFKMNGVNDLYRVMNGGNINDAIDADDVQWFSPMDVKLVSLV